MSKRKADDKAGPNTTMDVDGDDSGSDEDMDMLDVDFEWFDPQPAVDFHGLKTLLRQLLDVDNELFDLSELADLILSQPTLGSTVKCEGNESDPFAFLTVLNLHQHREKPVIQALTQYLLDKATKSPGPLSKLGDLLAPESSAAQVGLILTERFVNMPHQVVPPMYKMLLEEIQWAVDDKEPYEFTHYLVLSRTYTEVASQLDAEDSRPQKKTKAGAAEAHEEFYFHPEDEVLHKHAADQRTYDFTKQGAEGDSDSKRAFQELGVRPTGHVILVEAKRFEGAVKAVEQYLSADA